MTLQEKRLNKDDLVHYKEHQPSFQAMIPGIHNISSVGTAALKRAKPREIEQPGKLRMSMSLQDLQNPLNSTM